MRQIATAVGLALLATLPVMAADAPSDPSPDAGALSLADEAPTVKAAPQSWRLFGEGALARSWLRNPSASGNEGRASIDFRYDGSVVPQLRAVFSDRLDLIHRNGDLEPHDDNVNTLREAYVSWHATPDLIGDVGRVNLRYGAAFGYNPTDYFKGNALRTVVSIDPVSLRENRQGTVVVQGQKLWSDSSVSAAFSPKLSDSPPSSSTFSLNFGATNPSNRWLLAASHKFTEELNPQLVVFGGEHMSTQAGLNVSGLVNRATVAYLEFSGGRGPSMITPGPRTQRTGRGSTARRRGPHLHDQLQPLAHRRVRIQQRRSEPCRLAGVDRRCTPRFAAPVELCARATGPSGSSRDFPLCVMAGYGRPQLRPVGVRPTRHGFAQPRAMDRGGLPLEQDRDRDAVAAIRGLLIFGLRLCSACTSRRDPVSRFSLGLSGHAHSATSSVVTLFQGRARAQPHLLCHVNRRVDERALWSRKITDELS